jgi:hypothetical protein
MFDLLKWGQNGRLNAALFYGQAAVVTNSLHTQRPFQRTQDGKFSVRRWATDDAQAFGDPSKDQQLQG